MNSRQRAKEKLNLLKSNLDSVLVVHYSCESFMDKLDGYSPRISSIAIMDVGTGQVYSFSIHQYAELEKISKDQIEQHYDNLEKMMLDDYFAFLKKNNSRYYVHWNMRNSTYGFEALKHRYKVLGGTPI